MDNLWQSSLSSNTKAAYNTGLHCLLTFLTMSGVNIQLGKLPIIHEEVLIYFVTYCHTSLKLKWTIIKLYLASVRFHYLKLGFNNSLHAVDRLQYILRDTMSAYKASLTNNYLKVARDLLIIKERFFSPKV